jgi:hypothetical protein
MKRHLLVVLVASSLCSQVLAQTPQDKGRKMGEKATQLYQQGKLDEALRLFEEAYKLDPDPIYLRNMGKIYEKLGEIQKARSMYEESLSRETDPSQKSKTQGYLESLLEKMPGVVIIDATPQAAVVKIDGKNVEIGKPVEVRRGSHVIEATAPGYAPYKEQVEVLSGYERKVSIALKALPGKLVVRCNVEGAMVTVDGQDTRTAPIVKPFEVLPGLHVVEAKKDGYERWVRSIEVKMGEEVALDVGLVPTVKPEPTPPRKTEPKQTEVLAKKAEVKRALWPWVSLGVGAGMLITGGVMSGLAASEKGKIESTHVGVLGDIVTTPRSEAQSHSDKAKTYEKVSFAMYAVGGAAVITSVVLFVVKPGSKEKTSKPDLVLSPVAYEGGASLCFEGRF